MNLTFAFAVGLLALAVPALAQQPSPGTTDTAATPAAAPSLAEAQSLLEQLRSRSRPMPWTPEELDHAAQVMQAAAQQEPENESWIFGQALIALNRGDKVKNRELMRKVVTLKPDIAEYQARLGTAVFNSITGMGTDALDLSEEGKAAYEKAIALEAANVEARMGLAMYYIEAPALFGGSYRKAKEQAQALVDSEQGNYFGYMLLARIAGRQDKWKEMDTHFIAMRTATGDAASKEDAIIAHANALLSLKKDDKRALEVIRELDSNAASGSLSVPQQVSYHAIRGRSFAKQSRWQEAYDELSKVITLAPATARLSRMELAKVCEKLAKHLEAAEHYEAYVQNFPNADDKDDARSKAQRLRKRLQQ